MHIQQMCLDSQLKNSQNSKKQFRNAHSMVNAATIITYNLKVD